MIALILCLCALHFVWCSKTHRAHACSAHTRTATALATNSRLCVYLCTVIANDSARVPVRHLIHNLTAHQIARNAKYTFFIIPTNFCPARTSRDLRHAQDLHVYLSSHLRPTALLNPYPTVLNLHIIVLRAWSKCSRVHHTAVLASTTLLHHTTLRWYQRDAKRRLVKQLQRHGHGHWVGF